MVSGRLDLDPNSRLFADPAGNRTIVLTGAGADADRRRALEEVADVVICGDRGPEPRAMRAALEERGHRRILREGGPTLFADLAAAGVVDELCLSLTPLLAGPGPGRITTGAVWEAGSVAMTLTTLLEEVGALFARYRLG